MSPVWWDARNSILTVAALLAAALSTPLAVADTPVIERVIARVEGPCLSVSYAVDIRGGRARTGFYYGLDPSPKGDFSTGSVSSPGGPPTRTLATCNLPPQSKVYFQPFATDQGNGDEGLLQCAAACRNCDFGVGSSDAHCDAAGEAPYVETPAFDDITPPALPRHAADAMEEPNIDGQTFTVDCRNGLATNFMALVGQAAAANPNQWHKVEVPSGCKVKGQFRFPQRGAGQGGILITTAADPKLLPPPGVRIDPSFRPVLAQFEAPSDYSWMGGADTSSSWFYTQRGSGYRFQNIALSPPKHTEMPVQRFEINSVDQSGGRPSFSLDAPAGAIQFRHMMLMDLEGCSGGQGYVEVPAPPSGGFSAGSLQLSGRCSGGTATLAISWPLVGCSPGDPVRCETASPHGIPNLEALPIESIRTESGGQVLVSLSAAMHNVLNGSRRYLIRDDVAHFEGTGTPLDGGSFRVLTSDQTQVRIAADVSAGCSASCGTIRELHPIQVAETGSQTFDGTYHFRSAGPTTVELLGATLGSPTTGGFLAYDPPPAHVPLGFAFTSRIVFDRVLLECGSFPFRERICMNFAGSEEIAVVNSFIRGASYWLPLDPLTRSMRSAREGQNSFWPQATTVFFSAGKDVQIRNNTIYDTHGIVLFADQMFQNIDRQSRDVTVQRTTVHKPYRFLAGHPESDGRYYQDRHCFEMKSADRLLVEGLRCSGNFADWTPTAPAIALTSRGFNNVSSPILMRDVTIRGSVFERTSSGIQLARETNVPRNAPATQRVEIAHNIFADLDFFTHRSLVSGVNGLAPSDGFGGYLLSIFGAHANINFHRNTVGFQRGRSTELLHVIADPSSVMRIENNILNFSKTPNGIFGMLSERQGWRPGCQGVRGAAVFDCYFNRAGSPDPLSRFDGNVIYPCLKDAASGSREQTQSRIGTPGGSLGSGEAASYFGNIHRTTPNDYLRNSGARTCAERLNEIFEPGTFIPKGRYQGKGAEPALVKRYLGEVGEVTVAPGSDEVRIQYEAPDEEACTIDVATETTFRDPQKMQRVSDGGGQQQRDVRVTGLQPATDYAYRVLCAAQQPRGVFKTQ